MSSIAGASKVFITTRRRTCIIEIGRTFPGHGLRGRSNERYFLVGNIPRSEEPYQVGERRKASHAGLGVMRVVTKKCKIRGVIKSGPGTEWGCSDRTAFSTAVSAMSGVGGRSGDGIGCTGVGGFRVKGGEGGVRDGVVRVRQRGVCECAHDTTVLCFV